MIERVDLFYGSYRHFTSRVLDAIRKETFGVDIGQNSWITVGEYDRFVDWLGLTVDRHALEVASGSGGPALYLAGKAGCRVTGIDVNPDGVETALRLAAASGVGRKVEFRVVDASGRLPFGDDAFDALLCIDSMNHLVDRPAVLGEWRRVLRPEGRAVFTDPVVVTGPVTNDELALRSSIGVFLFTPAGLNEQLIEQSGLRLLRREDVSDTAAGVADRWRRAREAHREALLEIEGEERYQGLQRFFEAVHRLTGERRLSRIAYLVEKR